MTAARAVRTPTAGETNPRHWFSLAVASALLSIAAGLAIPRLVDPPAGAFLGWLAAMALVLLTFAAIGLGTTGQWFGMLIDDRRKMSSSRTQMVLWTALVLGALLAAAGANMAAGHEAPLNITVPGELWVLMGLASTSLAASELIKTTQVRSDSLRLNPSNRHADLGDLIESEGVGEEGTVDLGKVQMLFLTAVILGVYAVAVGDILAGGTQVLSLPAIDEGMVALLAISHGGYVAYKAVPRGERRRVEGAQLPLPQPTAPPPPVPPADDR